MAKKSDSRHVVPRGDKWANVKSGGGELNIHRADGKIRQKDAIPDGNDPYPPKE